MHDLLGICSLLKEKVELWHTHIDIDEFFNINHHYRYITKNEWLEWTITQLPWYYVSRIFRYITGSLFILQVFNSDQQISWWLIQRWTWYNLKSQRKLSPSKEPTSVRVIVWVNWGTSTLSDFKQIISRAGPGLNILEPVEQ